MKFKKISVIITSCYFLICNLTLAQTTPMAVGDGQKIKLFFEKTYLHTDRSYYSGGEDLWFSAYLVNGKSTSLTSTSNNLYVELISPKSEILDRKIIRVDQGLGKGDFQLKDSLPSGWYQLRAYTNWMRNFGDNFTFQKKIYITSKVTDNSKKTVVARKNVINFFPEGGALVEGVNGIVAFKTEDENGNGLSVTGKVISSKGDTVATFQSTAAGMGIFAFTPIVGENYRISGTFGNQQKITDSFPKALAKGLSMHVNTDSVAVKIAISMNDLMFADLNTKPITIVIKHGGDNIYSGAIPVTKSSFAVTIPTKDFPAGVAVITLVDPQGKPNCERLVYIQPINPVKLTVNLAKTSYKPREKVTLTIKASDAMGKPVQSSISLAAIDGLVPNDPTNIVNYLMLQSEIRGEIKDVDKYFDPSNPSRTKQLDLLLLTQGWRDYLWRKLADSALKITYAPEPGITLAGKVRQKLADKPMPDMNITLFGSGFNGDKLYSAKTDVEGRYYFNGISWNGNQPIKISARDAKGKKAGWIILDTVFKAPIPVNFTPIGSEIPTASFSTTLNDRRDYNKAYKTGDTITLNSVNVVADKTGGKVALFDENMMTFGYVDQVFDITDKDYSYKGLEHFLLTKAKGAYPVEDTDTVGADGITFLSNGKKIRPRIIVNNREELVSERLDYYSLTMDQINQIRIKHLVNNSGSDVYVVSLNLKETALRGTNLDILNSNITGYYTSRAFYVPNHIANSTALKDLRTTIYWSPLIKTNAQGEASVSFFNADPKGEIILKAEGITATGTPVFTKTSYKVQ